MWCMRVLGIGTTGDQIMGHLREVATILGEEKGIVGTGKEEMTGDRDIMLALTIGRDRIRFIIPVIRSDRGGKKFSKAFTNMLITESSTTQYMQTLTENIQILWFFLHRFFPRTGLHNVIHTI